MRKGLEIYFPALFSFTIYLLSSKDSEKALMALLSNDGKSVPEIALMLKRNQRREKV